MATAICSPVSIVVSGSEMMSACIATAVCATDTGSVASPAVFQVMTRTLVSVSAGSSVVPIPRVATIAPLPSVPTIAIKAIERANPRRGRAIARSSIRIVAIAKATATSDRKATI